MKNALLNGLGIGSGVAIYEVLTNGVSGANWYRAIFVGVFCTVIFAVYNSLKPKSEG
ncbi:hypothetical protein [Idiomarina piscisalsi]|uniref:hypothetical protein n=1 Tax=Idiomarina piscisalsi TaxID=1096243 RepID=UPI0026EBC3C8|nr:hypothetical protein [Idiomarina piscisalsi]